VIAHPDEDTPRLMYADWLEENGHDPDSSRSGSGSYAARAEFIRTHIEYTRLPKDDPRSDALADRAVALWSAHRKKWYGGLKGHGPTFVRGFIEGAWTDFVFDLLDTPAFLRHPIRVLYIDRTFPDDWTDEAARCPLFARLTGLGTTGDYWDRSALRAVLAFPPLAGLRMLDFHDAYLNGPRAAIEVARATNLTRLEVLDLTGNHVGIEGLAALADAPHLRTLRVLRLGSGGESSNGITATGLAELTRSRHFTGLEQLVVESNRRVRDEGLVALLRWQQFAHLTELDIGWTGLTEDGIVALARCRRAANLTRLNLSGNEFTEAAARALLGSKYLTRLTDLCLPARGFRVSDATTDALIERFGMKAITGGYRPTRLTLEDRIGVRMRFLRIGQSRDPEDVEILNRQANEWRD
jgi:uncharacterized protein (TIGR02996 family)